MKDLVDFLRKETLEKEETILLSNENLAVTTGDHTGRSPNAKFIVIDNKTVDSVDWRNVQGMHSSVWQEYKRDFFESEYSKLEFYTTKLSAGHNDFFGLKIKINCEYAWHSLFSLNMFEYVEDCEDFDFELYYVPSYSTEPSVVISFEDGLIIISGTQYAGEMKKSVFTVLNHLLPENNMFPMHCSVNLDSNMENPCIFFGLSGTGKTTLSAETSRILIGDDEHGWSKAGIFNFENGCYAKVIDLNEENEPEIWAAAHGRLSILENVEIVDDVVDFKSRKYTENTRCSYPLSYISNSSKDRSTKKQPKNVILLTCDAFGILPAVAKLNPEEAEKFFTIGYTSKVAGTEKGVKEPTATFSPCFGLPFMTRNPKEYAAMLREFLEKEDVQCWMLNTGWTNGPYGAGERISISKTRLLLSMIHEGKMHELETFEHSYTGMNIPVIKDIELTLLKPELGWANTAKYQESCQDLLVNMRKTLSEY